MEYKFKVIQGPLKLLLLEVSSLLISLHGLRLASLDTDSETGSAFLGSSQERHLSGSEQSKIGEREKVTHRGRS